MATKKGEKGKEVAEPKSGVALSRRQELAMDVIKKPKMCRVEQLRTIRPLGQGAFGHVSLVSFNG